MLFLLGRRINLQKERNYIVILWVEYSAGEPFRVFFDTYRLSMFAIDCIYEKVQCYYSYSTL